jgi:hypothetical protein
MAFLWSVPDGCSTMTLCCLLTRIPAHEHYCIQILLVAWVPFHYISFFSLIIDINLVVERAKWFLWTACLILARETVRCQMEPKWGKLSLIQPSSKYTYITMHHLSFGLKWCTSVFCPRKMSWKWHGSWPSPVEIAPRGPSNVLLQPLG